MREAALEKTRTSPSGGWRGRDRRGRARSHHHKGCEEERRPPTVSPLSSPAPAGSVPAPLKHTTQRRDGRTARRHHTGISRWRQARSLPRPRGFSWLWECSRCCSAAASSRGAASALSAFASRPAAASVPISGSRSPSASSKHARISSLRRPSTSSAARVLARTAAVRRSRSRLSSGSVRRPAPTLATHHAALRAIA